MLNFSISIMTFNGRFDSCFKSLVRKIKSLDSSVEIIVGVNGNYNETFDENYRKNMLLFLSEFDNVFPIFFPKFRGCSKIWNTTFIHSTKDNILFLSDDVNISNDNLLNDVNSMIDGTTFKLNNSFSHFVCNRIEIAELGWFDERLIGFGEEDGDMMYRFNEVGKSVGNKYVNGLYDIGLTSSSNFQKGVGKYTKFNRDWIFTNKYVPDQNGIKCMFSVPHKRICDNINLYPCEKFYWENYNKL